AGRLVHVNGVVVASRPGVLFLRDSAGTLEVRTGDGTSARPGDLVDAAGFADTGGYSPRLVDAVVRKTGQRALPEPVSTNPRDLLRNGTDTALVRVRARVLQTVATTAEHVLVLDADGQPFSAHLALSGDNAGGLRPVQNGSLVEVDGVSSLQVAREGNRLVPREIRIVLPSADAVRVLETPPWFTNVHILWALAALAAVTLLSAGAIVVLRRRIRGQTAQLRRAKEAAEAANRDRTVYLTRMSHEVRTPLNGVLGVTELLLEASRDGEQKQFLGMVKSSAESLFCVINDMLDLSKLEPGKMELHPDAFDLREMLGGVVQMLGVRAGEKTIRLTLTVAPDVPTRIVADADRLRQVMVNLAGNAVKFTERGSVAITVNVAAPPGQAADEESCELQFAVADTGIGISAETQTLLFEVVEQGGDAAIATPGNPGLGLPTSARIVSMMGGRMHVNSAPGRGTTFSFGIRVAVAPPEPRPAATAVQAAAPAVRALKTTRVPLRVLVAEDNFVNQKLAEALLARRGQDTVIVANGREAIDAWRRGSFDLIFMDVQMPVMDGFEATAAIREAERGTNRHVAIVAMTAHAMSGDRQRCLAAGMDDYISKPVSTREFDRVLREVAAARFEERDLQTA
ncbi:MAG: response regulator, partial [Burkholderiales bacterium]